MNACEIYAIKTGQTAWIVRARFVDANGASRAGFDLGHYAGEDATRAAMRASYLGIKGTLDAYTDGNMLITVQEISTET